MDTIEGSDTFWLILTPYIIEGLNDNEQGWETLHGCRVEYELLTALYEMTAAKEIPLWAVL